MKKKADEEVNRAFERPIGVQPGPTGSATGGERTRRDSPFLHMETSMSDKWRTN